MELEGLSEGERQLAGDTELWRQALAEVQDNFCSNRTAGVEWVVVAVDGCGTAGQGLQLPCKGQPHRQE